MTSMERFVRLEWFALFVFCLLAYHLVDAPWWLFAVLILVPDLSMLAYLFGPRIGAIGYNSVHNLILPLGLLAWGWMLHAQVMMAVALIWIAHIGMDRMLGYGLKRASGFGDTHMGALGRRKAD